VLRRVWVPVPAVFAAAALVFLVTAFAVLLYQGLSNVTTETAFFEIASDSEVMQEDFLLKAISMEALMQYLGLGDTSGMAVMRLPENRSFTNYGNPRLVRSSGYSHTNTGWRPSN
jgi:hypothetical protein